MSHDNLPVKDPDLGHSVANPGLEEHVPRYVDVDEAAGNRAYRGILLMLGLVPLLAIAFVVIYFAVPRDMVIDFGILTANAQNVGFGLTGGLSAVLIGVSVIQWAKLIMDDREMVEMRHSASSSPGADRAPCCRAGTTASNSPASAVAS